MEVRNASRPLHVLLTGPPGIGKTTICKKVASLLDKNDGRFDGFYTEEVRDQRGCRIGFDIVKVKDPEKRLPLARAKHLSTSSGKDFKYQVGNYHVFLDNFEAIAFPVLDSDIDILLVDEIGKMELLSKNFERKITDILLGPSKTTSVIGTIPQIHKVPKQHAALFQRLRTNDGLKILNVSYQNRNNLPEEIIRFFS